jgi:hypothetical protein
MGQLFCIPMKDKNECYYDTPRMKPIKDKPFEERNIVNYYAIPRVAPNTNERRLSIREPDKEVILYLPNKEVAIYVPNWRNSITNYKPFIIQNNLKTTP